jgi:hypothetical protein
MFVSKQKYLLKIDQLLGLILKFLNWPTQNICWMKASVLYLKGQYIEIFKIPFFIKQFTLVQLDMPRIEFELCRIFVEIFVYEILKNQLHIVKEEWKIEP